MSTTRLEALEVSSVTRQQLSHYAKILPGIIRQVKSFLPNFIVTVGRGSSGHAASFAKYVFETQMGLVTASAAPSIETLYHTPLLLGKALVIGFSQSGQSQDLCEVVTAARKAGALTIAFVNKINSPLAQIAHMAIPLCAGEEVAVAATKSFIATLVAILSFVGYWKEDGDLLEKLRRLPEYFIDNDAGQPHWSHFIHDLAKRTNIFILGRGFTFPIAMKQP